MEPGLLASHGAVHRDVAAQMAQGVRQLMDASYGLATTGVAGPEPQDGQEIGTLFVAVCGPWGTVVDEPHTDDADVGGAIRQTAVIAALELLRDHLRPPQ
ncbi:CinA family protein [Streptomyces sp. NPDC001530]|uniref:CinA family protein n=1 Tax=Streptomyces sp. NPDC001530 TaxID=3364582 RepID=UPI0036A14DBC